jgi:hypothetical protein
MPPPFRRSHFEQIWSLCGPNTSTTPVVMLTLLLLVGTKPNTAADIRLPVGGPFRFCPSNSMAMLRPATTCSASSWTVSPCHWQDCSLGFKGPLRTNDPLAHSDINKTRSQPRYVKACTGSVKVLNTDRQSLAAAIRCRRPKKFGRSQ